jgi:hypothetical protein
VTTSAVAAIVTVRVVFFTGPPANTRSASAVSSALAEVGTTFSAPGLFARSTDPADDTDIVADS